MRVSLQAGSIGNPATTMGGWLAGGLMGGGFDFGATALVSLLSHLAAPMVGGILSAAFWSLLLRDLGGMLTKLGLSSNEFFGSFLIVLAAAGIGANSGTASDTLAYSVVVMVVLDMVPTSATPTACPDPSASGVRIDHRADAADTAALLVRRCSRPSRRISSRPSPHRARSAPGWTSWVLPRSSSPRRQAPPEPSTPCLPGPLWCLSCPVTHTAVRLLRPQAGAVLAGVLAAWMFGGSIGGAADADITLTMLNGTLWGILLGWAYK